MFRCLFCGISWPMLCCYWFRWANFHNGRHQRDLQILQQSGENVAAFDTAAGMAFPGNVIKVGNSEGNHPAAFPIGLPVFFVKAYTDPGGIVFDPFMGSGTTLIAADQEGRRGYGCEISPGYCDIIRRRWTAWAKDHGQEPGPGALE